MYLLHNLYNQAITRAQSHHDREDRQWTFSCTSLTSGYRLTDCQWSGYINYWDAGMNYNCPNDGLIRTITSHHNNGREDRRFRFECLVFISCT